MERRLVDHDDALKTTDIFRAARQRLDTEARRKADAVGRNLRRAAILAQVLEKELLDFDKLLTEPLGEVRDIADEFPALVLGVAYVKDVVAACVTRRCRDQGIVQRLGIGDAGPSSFLAQLQVRLVFQPFGR
ncbi:hypothetical protein JT366_09310 [Sphingomonas paucimobilis]|uniref:hypothetical protein n=1 Tax=Sphingomonas paucimobilis TaxID=13689 RepID=UPI0019640360|nr:hypothetical protein [Sphingomonas paucimobilis]QRY97391.1 hypothetical protein JT366_09310 [Sphingomonas paucimobilis]